ncbi:hypothetical protein GGF32_006451 [Allomyces javanicus]|nr:hypothetical protein GGF32_006451 [Allomyces javanicus]
MPPKKRGSAPFTRRKSARLAAVNGDPGGGGHVDANRPPAGNVPDTQEHNVEERNDMKRADPAPVPSTTLARLPPSADTSAPELDRIVPTDHDASTAMTQPTHAGPALPPPAPAPGPDAHASLGDMTLTDGNLCTILFVAAYCDFLRHPDRPLYQETYPLPLPDTVVANLVEVLVELLSAKHDQPDRAVRVLAPSNWSTDASVTVPRAVDAMIRSKKLVRILLLEMAVPPGTSERTRRALQNPERASAVVDAITRYLTTWVPVLVDAGGGGLPLADVPATAKRFRAAGVSAIPCILDAVEMGEEEEAPRVRWTVARPEAAVAARFLCPGLSGEMAAAATANDEGAGEGATLNDATAAAEAAATSNDVVTTAAAAASNDGIADVEQTILSDEVVAVETTTSNGDMSATAALNNEVTTAAAAAAATANDGITAADVTTSNDVIAAAETLHADSSPDDDSVPATDPAIAPPRASTPTGRDGGEQEVAVAPHSPPWPSDVLQLPRPQAAAAAAPTTPDAHVPQPSRSSPPPPPPPNVPALQQLRPASAPGALVSPPPADLPVPVQSQAVAAPTGLVAPVPLEGLVPPQPQAVTDSAVPVAFPLLDVPIPAQPQAAADPAVLVAPRPNDVQAPPQLHAAAAMPDSPPVLPAAVAGPAALAPPPPPPVAATADLLATLTPADGNLCVALFVAVHADRRRNSARAIYQRTYPVPIPAHDLSDLVESLCAILGTGLDRRLRYFAASDAATRAVQTHLRVRKTVRMALVEHVPGTAGLAFAARKKLAEQDPHRAPVVVGKIREYVTAWMPAMLASHAQGLPFLVSETAGVVKYPMTAIPCVFARGVDDAGQRVVRWNRMGAAAAQFLYPGLVEELGAAVNGEESDADVAQEEQQHDVEMGEGHDGQDANVVEGQQQQQQDANADQDQQQEAMDVDPPEAPTAVVAHQDPVSNQILAQPAPAHDPTLPSANVPNAIATPPTQQTVLAAMTPVDGNLCILLFVAAYMDRAAGTDRPFHATTFPLPLADADIAVLTMALTRALTAGAGLDRPVRAFPDTPVAAGPSAHKLARSILADIIAPHELAVGAMRLQDADVRASPALAALVRKYLIEWVPALIERGGVPCTGAPGRNVPLALEGVVGSDGQRGVRWVADSPQAAQAAEWLYLGLGEEIVMLRRAAEEAAERPLVKQMAAAEPEASDAPPQSRGPTYPSPPPAAIDGAMAAELSTIPNRNLCMALFAAAYTDQHAHAHRAIYQTDFPLPLSATHHAQIVDHLISALGDRLSLRLPFLIAAKSTTTSVVIDRRRTIRLVLADLGAGTRVRAPPSKTPHMHPAVRQAVERYVTTWVPAVTDFPVLADAVGGVAAVPPALEVGVNEDGARVLRWTGATERAAVAAGALFAEKGRKSRGSARATVDAEPSTPHGPPPPIQSSSGTDGTKAGLLAEPTHTANDVVQEEQEEQEEETDVPTPRDRDHDAAARGSDDTVARGLGDLSRGQDEAARDQVARDVVVADAIRDQPEAARGLPAGDQVEPVRNKDHVQAGDVDVQRGRDDAAHGHDVDMHDADVARDQDDSMRDVDIDEMRDQDDVQRTQDGAVRTQDRSDQDGAMGDQDDGARAQDDAADADADAAHRHVGAPASADTAVPVDPTAEFSAIRNCNACIALFAAVYDDQRTNPTRSIYHDVYPLPLTDHHRTLLVDHLASLLGDRHNLRLAFLVEGKTTPTAAAIDRRRTIRLVLAELTRVAPTSRPSLTRTPHSHPAVRQWMERYLTAWIPAVASSTGFPVPSGILPVNTIPGVLEVHDGEEGQRVLRWCSLGEESMAAADVFFNETVKQSRGSSSSTPQRSRQASSTSLRTDVPPSTPHALPPEPPQPAVQSGPGTELGPSAARTPPGLDVSHPTVHVPASAVDSAHDQGGAVHAQDNAAGDEDDAMRAQDDELRDLVDALHQQVAVVVDQEPARNDAPAPAIEPPRGQVGADHEHGDEVRAEDDDFAMGDREMAGGDAPRGAVDPARDQINVNRGHGDEVRDEDEDVAMDDRDMAGGDEPDTIREEVDASRDQVGAVREDADTVREQDVPMHDQADADGDQGNGVQDQSGASNGQDNVVNPQLAVGPSTDFTTIHHRNLCIALFGAAYDDQCANPTHAVYQAEYALPLSDADTALLVDHFSSILGERLNLRLTAFTTSSEINWRRTLRAVLIDLITSVVTTRTSTQSLGKTAHSHPVVRDAITQYLTAWIPAIVGKSGFPIQPGVVAVNVIPGALEVHDRDDEQRVLRWTNLPERCSDAANAFFARMAKRSRDSSHALQRSASLPSTPSRAEGLEAARPASAIEVNYPGVNAVGAARGQDGAVRGQDDMVLDQTDQTADDQMDVDREHVHDARENGDVAIEGGGGAREHVDAAFDRDDTMGESDVAGRDESGGVIGDHAGPASRDPSAAAAIREQANNEIRDLDTEARNVSAAEDLAYAADARNGMARGPDDSVRDHGSTVAEQPVIVGDADHAGPAAAKALTTGSNNVCIALFAATYDDQSSNLTRPIYQTGFPLPLTDEHRTMLVRHLTSILGDRLNMRMTAFASSGTVNKTRTIRVVLTEQFADANLARGAFQELGKAPHLHPVVQKQLEQYLTTWVPAVAGAPGFPIQTNELAVAAIPGVLEVHDCDDGQCVLRWVNVLERCGAAANAFFAGTVKRSRHSSQTLQRPDVLPSALQSPDVQLSTPPRSEPPKPIPEPGSRTDEPRLANNVMEETENEVHVVRDEAGAIHETPEASRDTADATQDVANVTHAAPDTVDDEVHVDPATELTMTSNCNVCIALFAAAYDDQRNNPARSIYQAEYSLPLAAHDTAHLVDHFVSILGEKADLRLAAFTAEGTINRRRTIRVVLAELIPGGKEMTRGAFQYLSKTAHSHRIVRQAIERYLTTWIPAVSGSLGFPIQTGVAPINFIPSVLEQGVRDDGQQVLRWPIGIPALGSVPASNDIAMDAQPVPDLQSDSDLSSLDEAGDRSLFDEDDEIDGAMDERPAAELMPVDKNNVCIALFAAVHDDQRTNPTRSIYQDEYPLPLSNEHRGLLLDYLASVLGERLNVRLAFFIKAKADGSIDRRHTIRMFLMELFAGPRARVVRQSPLGTAPHLNPLVRQHLEQYLTMWIPALAGSPGFPIQSGALATEFIPGVFEQYDRDDGQRALRWVKLPDQYGDVAQAFSSDTVARSRDSRSRDTDPSAQHPVEEGTAARAEDETADGLTPTGDRSLASQWALANFGMIVWSAIIDDQRRDSTCPIYGKSFSLLANKKLDRLQRHELIAHIVQCCAAANAKAVWQVPPHGSDQRQQELVPMTVPHAMRLIVNPVRKRGPPRSARLTTFVTEYLDELCSQSDPAPTWTTPAGQAIPRVLDHGIVAPDGTGTLAWSAQLASSTVSFWAPDGTTPVDYKENRPVGHERAAAELAVLTNRSQVRLCRLVGRLEQHMLATLHLPANRGNMGEVLAMWSSYVNSTAHTQGPTTAAASTLSLAPPTDEDDLAPYLASSLASQLATEFSARVGSLTDADAETMSRTVRDVIERIHELADDPSAQADYLSQLYENGTPWAQAMRAALDATWDLFGTLNVHCTPTLAVNVVRDAVLEMVTVLAALARAGVRAEFPALGCGYDAPRMVPMGPPVFTPAAHQEQFSEPATPQLQSPPDAWSPLLLTSHPAMPPPVTPSPRPPPPAFGSSDVTNHGQARKRPRPFESGRVTAESRSCVNCGDTEAFEWCQDPISGHWMCNTCRRRRQFSTNTAPPIAPMSASGSPPNLSRAPSAADLGRESVPLGSERTESAQGAGHVAMDESPMPSKRHRTEPPAPLPSPGHVPPRPDPPRENAEAGSGDGVGAGDGLGRAIDDDPADARSLKRRRDSVETMQALGQSSRVSRPSPTGMPCADCQATRSLIWHEAGRYCGSCGQRRIRAATAASRQMTIPSSGPSPPDRPDPARDEAQPAASDGIGPVHDRRRASEQEPADAPSPKRRHVETLQCACGATGPADATWSRDMHRNPVCRACQERTRAHAMPIPAVPMPPQPRPPMLPAGASSSQTVTPPQAQLGAAASSVEAPMGSNASASAEQPERAAEFRHET